MKKLSLSTRLSGVTPLTAFKEETRSSLLPERQICRHFTISEIRSATQNFKESLLIGKGGFGSVYKGILKNGMVVAIKRCFSSSYQSGEFETEVEILPMFKHPKIVRLIGYCDDKDNMSLVYEYMSNGSLGDHLHVHRTPLSWSQRLMICIDAACALDYVHNGMNGQGVIHRDVKSSNLLFDSQWAIKVTDFGLSKRTPIDYPSSPVTTRVIGTLGYLDPEYMQTGRASTKSDVYSFGVVLLEVLCRRRPMDVIPAAEIWRFLTWAQNCLSKGELEQIIDPELKGQISLKCLNIFAIILECCLRERQEQRITMSEVMVGLQSILAIQDRIDYSSSQMGLTTFDRILQKHFHDSRKTSAQAPSGSNTMPPPARSEIDVISEESYLLEGLSSPSESNRGVTDEEFMYRDRTKSLHDMMQLEYIQRVDALSRMKDLLHLIWFYPMEKKAEINFGSLVHKFSSLSKYIRKSQDPSLDENYLLKIQTLLLDVEECLDAASFDLVAYLPEDLAHNCSGPLEFENLSTGADSWQLPTSSVWSGIPEIHASTIASARDRALRSVKDLKVKKLRISGNGAEEVVATLKDTLELKSVFDMVLFVCVKNHNIQDLMDDIEEEIILWRKKSLEIGNRVYVANKFLNCLLFVDLKDVFIDLHQMESSLSEWFRSLHIVMACKPQSAYFSVDLDIRVQDHLLPWILFFTNVDIATVGKYPSIHRMAIRAVEKCHGHLLAIILLAKALRGVVDISVWELALQQLTSQQDHSLLEFGLTSDIMVRVLRFSWSRMESVSQRCIIQFALHYIGAEFEQSSLIHSWIRDGLVKSEQEGEHVFKDLIHSFFLERADDNFIRMRDETRDILVSHFLPRPCRLYLKQDGSESDIMPEIEEWDAREIYLINNLLSEVPINPKCPTLVKLFLYSNKDLMDVPVTFFDHMPSLQVLDLSDTSIKCLPSSISNLTSLQKLFVRDCDLFMELPPEIGALKHLKVFDSVGTKLVCLPEQFGSLTKLESLKFSLYSFAHQSKRSKQSMQIVPAENLSKLIRLKELSICVDSYDGWWEDEVKHVINILPKLRNLESLRLYFPSAEVFDIFMETENWQGVPIYQHLLNFRFIVGHLQQRLVCRLPLDLDEIFIKLPKCLKFTNGEGDTEVISKLLKHANSLILDRDWTIQSLSTFRLVEMEKLKFCFLAECNEMLEIVNMTDLDIEPMLGSLEYLSVHYMRSLSCIWNGPIHDHSLCNLKTLVLHTCPELRTIFTYGLLRNLHCLEYLVVEDCPLIKSIITLGYYDSTLTPFLPSLKRISLLNLSELVTISESIPIAPRLESLVIYDCPNLERLSHVEVSEYIKEIKGENEWWDALEWCEPEWTSGRPHYLDRVFVPLGTNGDIMDEVADAVNFLPDISDWLFSQQQVPKFRNWENEKDVPYTAYIEKAKKVRNTKVNHQVSDPSNKEPSLQAREEEEVKNGGLRKFEPEGPSEQDSLRKKHENHVSGEDVDFRKSNKRVPRECFSSDSSFDSSPMHTHLQERVGNKVNVSSESSAAASWTPGRTQIRQVTRPDKSVSSKKKEIWHKKVKFGDWDDNAPRFGDWDDNDSRLGESYSHLFKEVRENRHTGGGKSPMITTENTQIFGQSNETTKGFGCFPWRRK